jgi:hypothetical protein
VAVYLHFPNTPSWRGAYLSHRDFTVTHTELGVVVPGAIIVQVTGYPEAFSDFFQSFRSNSQIAH